MSFKDFHKDPIQQFKLWYEEAKSAYDSVPTPFDNATLCTVDKNHRPSSRIILIKEITEEGFTFFTNYHSKKAREISENPMAALLVYWGLLGRQVRIEGKLEKVDPQTSERYFQSRPRQSQIGAHASLQSEKLESRETLVERFNALEKKYDDTQVPRPDHWGGYILKPSLIEFWVDGEFRLHDRIEYQRNQSKWSKTLLNP